MSSKSRVTVILSVIIGLVILLAAGGYGVYSWYHKNLQPLAGGSQQTKIFKIKSGESSEKIANNLKKEKLINNALAFRVYLRLNDLSGKIQTGNYQLHSYLSTPDIAAIITSGETAKKVITVISGRTLTEIRGQMIDVGYLPSDVDNALNKSYSYSILADKPPNASLEGYLYPDTYHAEIGGDAETVVRMMLANMDSKVSPEIRRSWAANGLNLHQGVTLASIVQKEVSDTEDQKKVAQVLLARLKKGMKLEADPTFQYAATQLGVKASVDLESPYNTYKVAGLPPTPISNVGLGALDAVAQPAGTDYLFFVTGKDGVTRYSNTREEHEKNISEHGVSGQ